MGLGERMKDLESQEEIVQRLADTGWRLDGGFSEHLVICYDGDIFILVDLRGWGGNDPVYEIYDTECHLSYWVKEIPTPKRAATLLKEHGRKPEE
jgi:hypothetical protein